MATEFVSQRLTYPKRAGRERLCNLRSGEGHGLNRPPEARRTCRLSPTADRTKDPHLNQLPDHIVDPRCPMVIQAQFG